MVSAKIVNEIIQDVFLYFEKNPPGLEGFENDRKNLASAIERYKKDLLRINRYFKMSNIQTKVIKVLEVGCYYGFVSIVLSRIGFDVTVTELADVLNCNGLREKLDSYNIKYKAHDLKNPFPFEEKTFDFVIFCETLEHLNFNPLIALNNMNYVLKVGGALYLTVPNITRIENIWMLIKGFPLPSGPVPKFTTPRADGTFEADDYGIHWKEYTVNEIRKILSLSNFKINKLFYENAKRKIKCPWFQFIWRNKVSFIFDFLNNLFPHLSKQIVLFAEKESDSNLKFYYRL